MSVKTIETLIGIAALLLAVIAMLFGINLLPSCGEASERGIFAPLIITWTLGLIATGSAVTLGVFLLTFGRRAS